MRIIPLFLALIATASVVPAQATCTTSTGSSRTLFTNDPFGGNSLFGHPGYPTQVTLPYDGFNFLIDVTTAVPITIDRIDLDLYGTGGTVNTGAGTFLHPNQVGNTTLVEVYTCASTYLGNETIPPSSPGSPWTLLGTAVLTVSDNHTDSIIDFNTTFPGSSGPISVTPGATIGMAIQVHPVPSPTGPTGQPNTLTWNPMEPSTPWTAPWPLHPMLDPGITAPASYTDGILTLASVAFQRDAFASGPSPQTLTQNIEVHYAPGAGSANWTSFGTGCESRPRMVFEQFPAVSTIDLVNTSQTLINSPAQDRFVINQGGPSYNQFPLGGNAVDLAAGSYTSASSANWDDATVNIPVPTTTFPNGIQFPGGSTMDIAVNSNGKIYLGAVDPMDTSFATHGSNYGDLAPFQGATGDGDPTLAVLNCDLDPTAGGNIWYEDPSPQGGIRITWDNVPNWQDPAGPPAVNNFIQLEIVGNLFYFSYGSSLGNGGNSANDAIVGFSAGGGQPLSSPVDWSTLMNYPTGDGTSPPVMGLSARPVIGTTFNFETTNIKSGTPVNLIALAYVSNASGINLAPYGMPNCSLYLQLGTPLITVIDPVAGNVSNHPLTIPPSTALNGVNLFGQSAPFTAGYNSTGLFTSNAVCIAVGLF